MSLPQAVLRLSTDVLAPLNDDERLAFAYAHGPVLTGFGQDAELVCVWEADTVPAEVDGEAAHLTVAGFEALLDALKRGEGWREPDDEALHVMSRFAEGILLADDSELGSRARAEVTEFPQALADASRETLERDAELMAERLSHTEDPWERTDVLTGALHRAYVALFAASGHFFPGREHRREYVERYFLGDEVLEAEAGLWAAAERERPEAWRELVRAVLANCLPAAGALPGRFVERDRAGRGGIER